MSRAKRIDKEYEAGVIARAREQKKRIDKIRKAREKAEKEGKLDEWGFFKGDT